MPSGPGCRGLQNAPSSRLSAVIPNIPSGQSYVGSRLGLECPGRRARGGRFSDLSAPCASELVPKRFQKAVFLAVSV
eukprot:9477830-Pyramimonas_sp.AAC.1